MLELYDTLSRSLKKFEPLNTNEVGLYTCGPTVYNYAHIGNLRTYIFEDTLKRVLEYNNFKVNHVMNITDVGHLTGDADSGEDKMEKGAAREKKSVWDIAQFYTEEFKKDLRALNIIEPTIWCKATDHIPEQIALVQKLEEKDFTYRTNDGIYFDTSKLADYGKLANLKNQDLQAGARVEMGEKKNPTDFALWKFSPGDKQRQMEWESPWGKGFPGWHIECSAMATKYLGQPFDIHCGGIDHVPVHHTNEIAQSEAAEGKELAKYWMHGEFLLINKEKMAKSGENFFRLQTIKDHNINPLTYRYFVLQTHYRKQLNFSWEALEAAQNGLEHLYQSARQLSPSSEEGVRGGKEIEQKFLEFINDDLNTSEALALIWNAIKERSINRELLYKFDKVLGLKIKETIEAAIEIPEEVQKIIDERNQARNNKDWTKSDELRKKLEDLGYNVEDTKEGTSISI
jgi:cysteinyl-tRNA synthetase